MKRTKDSILYAIGGLCVMVCIMLTLVFSHYRNRNRNFEQIGQFFEELSHATAKHVADVFADKCASAESIAYLYGNAIQTTDVELDLLADLEEKSGFDWIRFVALDGTDYTSDGSSTNVKDREYFMRGIAGESGICEVLVSRINGEKLIGFYAPVYFNEEICGVIVGFLAESTVSEILETNLYDYPAATYIIRQDGAVIGRYMDDRTIDIPNVSEAIEYVDKAYKDRVNASIEKREYCQFIFQGPNGQSMGDIVPIAGSNWLLAQFFPSEATKIVMQSTFIDSIKTIGMITAIFAIFILFLFFTRKNIEKRRSEEIAYNKVNSLMRNVAEDYVCLIDIDLETEQDTCYRLSSGDKLENWEGENKDYTQDIFNYANRYVADYDRKRFIEATRLSVVRDVLSRQKDFYMEYDAAIDGDTRRHEAKITISENKPYENHMLISIRDITESTKERKEKERELSEAKIMAEAANKAKTTFLFNMSHDIRTPMNAIIGFRDLLEKHQEEPEKRADYLRKIEDASTVLLSILNNVLEMARIEKGTLEIDETAWSAEQFNDTLYSVFYEMMVQKGIEFTRQVVVNNHYVFCDPIKLREIFLNILSNAYKYTNPGGKVNMHLEEIESEREGYVLYRTTVSDTGIGMSKEFLPHIFEEFSRENNTTDNKIEGTGLGMPIVNRLVDLLGGTIEVKSEKGVGTTVVVTLPHRIAQKSDLVMYAGVELNPKLFEGKRILLAEDNELNAEIAVEILKEAGFVIELAEDGQICVDMLKKSPSGYYDLILMDIQMPHMNGYDATRTIRSLQDSEKANIPILAMTANAFEEDKREALSSGMNGHLAKPINVRELMRELASVLG